MLYVSCGDLAAKVRTLWINRARSETLTEPRASSTLNTCEHFKQ